MPIVVDPSVAAPPVASTVVSPDGKLTLTTDVAYGGIEIVANFSSLNPKPVRVRFERSDGSRVRGGDPAEAPGGIGYGYEHEARLGVGWSIRAIPIFRITSAGVDAGVGPGIAGTPPVSASGKQLDTDTTYADYALASSYASIVIPETTGMRDIWIKSLAVPSLSVLLSGTLPLLTESEESRFEPVTIPGSSYPAGAYDVRGYAAFDLTLAVESEVERKRFRDLRAAGPVLVQARSGYLDSGDFYALPGNSGSVPLRAQWDPRRNVTFTVQPIARPSTVETPLAVPGYSIAESYVLAPTITQASTTWPTVANASGF